MAPSCDHVHSVITDHPGWKALPGDTAARNAGVRRNAGRIVLLLGAIVFAAISSNRVGAADLWVDRNSLGGSCVNQTPRSENSKTKPWCTLGEAGTKVLPGDTVFVREGVYTETHDCNECWWLGVLQIVESGTSAQPISFVAYLDEEVELSSAGGASFGVIISAEGDFTPEFVEIEGFVIRGFSATGVMIQDASDITLRSLEVTECSDSVIASLNSSRITVEGCSVHDNAITGWTSAVNFLNCGAGNVARGNQIWANTDLDSRETEGHGIIMDSCGDSGSLLVENNIIWNNDGMCINIFESDYATVRNNTCWRNGVGRIDTPELFLVGQNAEFSNNILVTRQGSHSLKVDSALYPQYDLSTISTDFNIVWSPDTSLVLDWPPGEDVTLAQYQQNNPHGWEANSIQADPLLVDPSGADFAPTAPSPAVDSGSTSNAADRDFWGFNRPIDGNEDGLAREDRGSIEYGGIFRNGLEPNDKQAWTVKVQ